ncbi:putative MFS-type transporter YusP [Smittium culicis]|uniref:Putative MFS-type transporter YusP n=1 Tax=Smittium culicis TaxID=133412 RepID=A0A1R1YMG9_9FUNG|nr:putative MFS-type transporter YusP [Smittium culicis]
MEKDTTNITQVESSSNPSSSSNFSKDISVVEKNAPDTPYDVIEELPVKENVILVSGLAVALFLAALDNTIVSTALPTIANDLNSLSLISWVATSYMLSSTALQPLYGKVSDIFGTKACLIFAILIFQVGSLISGLSNSMVMLIVARGVTGIGGAGIMVLVSLVISQTIPLRNRGRYMGIIGAVFGLSSVVGPLLGGVFTDKASWRWCFYINLPLGIVSLLSVIFIVKVKPVSGAIKDKIARIDFFGVAIFIIALIMILLALNWGGSSYPWSSARILALLIVGFFLLIGFIIFEIKFPKEPLIPMRIFRIRNIAFCLASQFFLGYGMYGVIFYIPIYYNVIHDGTATQSGLFLLPFMLGLVVSSISSGQFISRTGIYRPCLWLGTAVLSVGVGLISTFSENTGNAKHIIYMAIAGLGLGGCMQSMVISVQASSPPDILSVTTTMVGFFRVIGGSIGLAIISAIQSSSLTSSLNAFTNEYPQFKEIADISRNNAKVIWSKTIDPIAKDAILQAYISSLKKVFVSVIPVVIIAFLLTLFVKHVELKKKDPTQSTNDEAIVHV